MKTIEAPGFVIPEIDDITRRDFLIGGAAALLLGGCGSGGNGNESSSDTRSVESPMGAVELPENPERLVAMYSVDVDVALVLELPLVGGGTAAGGADQAWASHQPEGDLEGVERLATYPTPNYEQIATLEPDAIVDSTTDDREQYDRLSEIAPTFNYHRILYQGENYTTNWKEGLSRVAAVFGRETVAEEYIADYEERAENLKSRLAERYPDATYATCGAFEAGVVLVTDTNQQPARILQKDLGLTPSENMPDTFESRPNISLERLDLLQDADFLFVRVEAAMEGEGRDRAMLDDIQKSPLWQSIPAVEKGRVVEYDAELYYASPLTASAYLDVVENSLLS